MGFEYRDIADDAAGEGLLSSDWRGPSFVERRKTPRAPKSRRVSVAEERERGETIVDRAKHSLIDAFEQVRAGNPPNIAELHTVARDVTRSVERNRFAVVNLTRLRSRHEYTYVHSVGVCALMVGLARELRLPESEIEDIGMAGLLHDIGKARVPVSLLDKPGPLTDDERVTINTHSERGHALLSRMDDIPAIALDVALHHHERIDGSGYPHGLKGDAISVHSRIAAIADVFDALTSRRAYKEGWTPARAIAWMSGAAGHFDARMLPAFRSLIGVFPAGTLVRLSSDRLAIVLDEPAEDPASPPVCVFHCAALRYPLTPTRCDTRRDPIVGIENPAAWNLPAFEELQESVLSRIN